MNARLARGGSQRCCCCCCWTPQHACMAGLPLLCISKDGGLTARACLSCTCVARLCLCVRSWIGAGACWAAEGQFQSLLRCGGHRQLHTRSVPAARLGARTIHPHATLAIWLAGWLGLSAVHITSHTCIAHIGAVDWMLPRHATHAASVKYALVARHACSPALHAANAVSSIPSHPARAAPPDLCGGGS